MKEKIAKADPEKLTGKQEDFCRLYVSLGSVSEAARLSGHKFPGARLAGERLLERPEIRKRVKRLKEAQKTAALRDTALRGLCRAALCDPADAFRLLTLEDEALKEAVTQAELLCVAEVKRQKGVTEIKFIDRVKALETVCRLAEESEGEKLGAADLISAVKASVGGSDYEA